MPSASIYEERLQGIGRLADALEERQGDLVEAAADDAGFPLKVTSMEIRLAVDHLRNMERDLPHVEEKMPYGDIAAIFPYDAPVVFLARLGGAALLTGNRLRFGFSSWTPETAEILADICRPFPELEPRLKQDNREFGLECTEDPGVRVLFISGASPVGEAYRERKEGFDKVFFAGPGGMPAALVLEDADLEPATRFIARRAFINGGQYCTTLKKVLVHRGLYDALRDGVLERVERIHVGDPMEKDTDVGPIRVERTRKILSRTLEQCREGRLLTGRMEDQWVHPYVLEMERIPDLEPFGPLLILKPFEDPREAVRELTESRYGFLVAFFGALSPESRSLLSRHFGMIHDNPDFEFTPLRQPFGGRKASGWILERRDGTWTERDGAFHYSRELCRRL